MTSALESMVVDEKQLPEKPVDREKVYASQSNDNERYLEISINIAAFVLRFASRGYVLVY